MRRLVLSANASLRKGGQGLNLYHLIEELKADFDLTVFCRDQSAAPSMAMHAVPESSISKFISKIPVLRRRRDWQTFFSEVHFDRYVAQRLPEADLFLGVVGQCAASMELARKKGYGTLLEVITAHIDEFGGAADRECAKFGVHSPQHPKLQERIRREYELADRIMVVSQYVRDTFVARGFREDRILVSPPPINVDEFPQADFSEPKFRVCFVGGLDPWKGFHYLIDAFRQLKVPDAELVLWGGTGSRPVAKYIADSKRADPRIKTNVVDVRQFGYERVYGKSSVLVHPSLSDGFAYVVAEAMASGIPVIVTATTGAAQFVVDGQSGYVVPPGDSAVIRDRLQYLADSPSVLRKMGQAAREAIRELTMDRFRRRLVSCLSAIARENP